ncbi:hypothetical protein FB567DRAFT_631649 [Paraphoma chrysanthemicola]|uniref:DUF7730 domain-containing protein n=1 Tax=Paraphoma chrysanthemicola TaxID=798071 RepID=A0A8K0VVD1_9PLEO|nr:hypothetical protein FB567DRAFT_631649 [Paraphoma chrysanthemicola]
MVKRTYSSRFKKRGEYQREPSRKRSKGNSDDELHWPLRPQASAALLKKVLRPSQPQPDSEDELAANIARRKNSASILDRALGGKLKTVKPKGQSIYGSREEFEATMQDQREEKKNNPKLNASYLPTPPSELQQQQTKHLNTFFPGLNGKAGKVISNISKPKTKPPIPTVSPTAIRATETSKVFEKIIKCAEPKEPYVPKQYEADRTPAPRRGLSGDRLSKEFRGNDLWSTNQNNSPFLRLPGAVRNRIYGYAFGGNTINICYETYRTTYINDQPAKQTPIFRYHCIAYDRLTNPFQEVRKGTIGIQHGLTLFNGVCRQLYLETASLPFQLNTIAFDSYNVMMNFLVIDRRLSRPQREAIHTLVLPDHLPASNILEFLPNLQRFYLGLYQYVALKGWYRVVREEGQLPAVVFTSY